MKIVVFADQIYPIEHVNGLLEIAKKSTTTIELVLVSSNTIDVRTEERLSTCCLLKCHSSDFFFILKKICKADIVIGLPSKYILLRLLSSIKLLKFLPVYFGPGKVTKATGYFKHPENSQIRILKTYLKFMLLNTYFIANDKLDGLYNAAAFGYPLSRIAIAPLPKYFYINERLCAGQKKSRPTGILIAPTHRWADVIAPLTQICMSEELLRDFDDLNVRIFHSRHPESVEVALNNKVHEFSDNWDDIDILVTDYSSIGDDFFNAGGRSLLYYVPDREEFELKQGAGIFFDQSLKLGTVHNKADDLIRNLIDLSKTSQDRIITEMSCPSYFKDLSSVRHKT